MSMSLFPAYSEDLSNPQKSKDVSNSTREEVAGTGPVSWLENSSFAIKFAEIPLPATPPPVVVEEVEHVPHSESSSVSPSPANEKRKSTAHKRKSKKQEHKRRRIEHEKVGLPQKDDNFYEDKSSARGNLTVKTLSRPAVPLYHIRFSSLGQLGFRPFSRKNRHRTKRYYQQVLELPEVGEGDEEPKPMLESTKHSGSVLPDNTLEEELSRRTAEFNRMLAEDPHNVEVWLKYVRYQDIVRQFELTYRRGGGAKGMRVTTDRKLSILDKALEYNSGSDALLRERFSLAESVLPADTISRQLADLVERQPSCVTLWRGYIRATQCSLSLCSATAVLKLYDQGMARLHQLRRGAPGIKTRPMEEGILDLLLDCGLFLRQAGLWEQLWTLLKLYLELNLAQPDTQLFKDIPSVSEDYVTSLEETVLSSLLPLPELWYRVERLREGAHWLPWTSNANCEDPQRLVFADDVSDMLHPITTPGLNFRLVVIVLTLLKVPMLPCRNTALQFIGLDQVPWHLDCIEPLLAMFYPQGTVELEDKYLLKDASSLVHGPQYLLDHWPGQEQYLEFVTKIFSASAKCLAEPARTALCVWWLRFERFLLILNRHGHCKIPLLRKKKIKSMVKEFLKLEENRNNSLFYLEYALVECELGQKEGACKILQTAITAQQGGMSVVSIMCERQKAGLCRLYRTLCEILLGTRAGSADVVVKSDDASSKQKALHTLIALGTGSSHADRETEPTVQEIAAAADKFHHITAELVGDVDKSVLANGSEHLLPNFTVDWVTCHAWFLLLTRSPWAAAAVFEDALAHVPADKNEDRAAVTVATCQREALFESYTSMLHHHCHKSAGSYSVLQDVLHRALLEYSNNLHFLATVANIEMTLGCGGSSWWKLTKYFAETSSLLAQVFQVFLARQKQAQLEEASVQSHTFLCTAGPLIPCPSGKNRLASLFRQLLSLPATKRCPLLWRLHLQFLAEQGQESSYHTAFYRAIEDCPWVKVLYVEATKLLPVELPHLQDLLMEKELRVHVTPEELDILRSDSPKV